MSQYDTAFTTDEAATMQSDASARGCLNMNGLTQFKPDAGKLTFTVIPFLASGGIAFPLDLKKTPKKNTLVPMWAYYRHGQLGLEGKAMATCLRTFGEKCPVCEYLREKQSEGDLSQQEKDVLKGMLAKVRNVFVVRHEGSIKVFDVSPYLFTDKLNAKIAHYPKYKNWGDVNDGYDLECIFSKKSMGSNSMVELTSVEFIKREKRIKDAIIESAPRVDALVTKLSPSKLKSLLPNGSGDDDTDDNDMFANVSEGDLVKIRYKRS